MEKLVNMTRLLDPLLLVVCHVIRDLFLHCKFSFTLQLSCCYCELDLWLLRCHVAKGEVPIISFLRRSSQIGAVTRTGFLNLLIRYQADEAETDNLLSKYIRNYYWSVQ